MRPTRFRAVAASVGPLARNEAADDVEGGGVEPGGATMRSTQRATKAEEIGRQQQQSRHVRRFQRSGEAGHEVVRTARAYELAERRGIGVIEQTAGTLPGRIEHGTGKPRLAHQWQEVEIGVAIRKHHPDDGGAARDRCQRANAVGAADARE